MLGLIFYVLPLMFQIFMKIDKTKCVGCGNCTYVCPMGAIYLDPTDHRATIDADACVECYTCYRGMSTEHLYPPLIRGIRKLLSFFRLRFEPEPDVCPTAAFVPDELQWPRIVRRAFSDPQVPHESTGIHGRGTEEVKTNDVTNRVKQGEAGFVVEFGRPGVGARFYDIQKTTMALARLGVVFEPNNPVTHLMSNPKTGEIRKDILNEKVLSAIVEFKAKLTEVPVLLNEIEEVSKQVDTVVSLGVSTRCDENGDNPLEELLQKQGYRFWRGKTNLGMGRALN